MMKRLMLIGGTLLVGVALSHAAELRHAGDTDSTYSAVLNRLKLDGYEIEAASKDAGIQTAMQVTGGYRQTGSYLKVTMIADGADQVVKIAAYDVKRFKALKTEPWSTPKQNEEKAGAAAAKLKTELGW